MGDRDVSEGQPARSAKELELAARIAELESQVGAEHELREAVGRLEAVAHVAFGGIGILENGVYLDLNDRLANALGYSREELIGRSVQEIVSPESYRVIVDKMRNGAEKVYEATAVRRDGTTFPVELCGVTSKYRGREVHVAAARDISERIKLQREIVEIGNKERDEISRELHDGLGQTLTGIKLLLATVGRALRGESSNQIEKVEEIVELIDEAIDETREFSHVLSPVLNDGARLPDALRMIAVRCSQIDGITCHCAHDEDDEAMTAERATHVYRIAQEAVNNSLRHANPTHINIDFTADSETFRLDVSDDGKGFDTAITPAEGMGLKSMRYRALVLGATFHVESTPGDGTHLVCLGPTHVDE